MITGRRWNKVVQKGRLVALRLMVPLTVTTHKP
jgi:hypothetical protein